MANPNWIEVNLEPGKNPWQTGLSDYQPQMLAVRGLFGLFWGGQPREALAELDRIISEFIEEHQEELQEAGDWHVANSKAEGEDKLLWPVEAEVGNMHDLWA